MRVCLSHFVCPPDFNCDEEEDVSKANILARILTVPEGPEILVYDNCHFIALYALC